MHKIHYEVSAPKLHDHLLKVTLTITIPDPDGQVVSMPSWIPGSYMIRDFAKDIVSISASTADGELELTKLDKQTWKLAATTKPVKITYEIYAWDMSVRGAHVDQTHMYFNGTSVYLMVHGQEETAVSVSLLQPDAGHTSNWRVATTLDTLSAKPYEFGVYQAKDYDELIDNPVEIGDFDVYTFEACGVPHEVVLTGKHYTDEERLCADLKKICETQINFFGGKLEIDRYMFMVQVLGNGYGGLEHKRCCSLHCARHELPRKGLDKTSTEYINFLSLCSHEYFHYWNIKRLKPKVFVPYDLTKEVHTVLLWVFEGFTRYYEDIMLIRSGVISESDYLKQISMLFTVLERAPGRKRQTVTESSFDAWTKLYKSNANSPNAIISYYTKGAVVAMAIDLSIRKLTDNQQSLDDVVLSLWQQYGVNETGVTNEEVLNEIRNIVGDSLNDELTKWLYSTDDIDMTKLFDHVGLDYAFRPMLSVSDRGGAISDATPEKATLGLRGSYSAQGLKVSIVLSGSTAEKAGIASGDVLVALDGVQIKSDWEQVVAQFAVGETLTVHGFREDLLTTYEITLQAEEKSTAAFSKKEKQTDAQSAAREKWLVNCA